MTETSSPETASFGTNAWLVDEMYRRFLDSPESVSEAWRDFFSDYRPASFVQPPPASTPPAEAEAVPIAPPQSGPTPAPAADPSAAPPLEARRLVGSSAVIAERMDESRSLPTATSVRTMPAKLLEVNRAIINNQLRRLSGGGKVSFTHLIGWAVVRAMADHPVMNRSYTEVDGQPHVVHPEGVNLGLAMDLPRKDGSRTLLVPNLRRVDGMDFRTYWMAYEEVVRRVRAGQITPADFEGTTITLTNPGTIGTVQSVPRLMPGQGTIVGVGAIGFPPEYEGADPETLGRLGVGRVITLTSTYDHRVIQGAESGMFLARVHELLLGEDDFYEEVFSSMEIPYVPARWAQDDNPPYGSEEWAEKQARVFQLINAYRVRGHLIADLDPLRLSPPTNHPELDPITYGLSIWDLDRRFAVGGLGGNATLELGTTLGLLRDAYGRTIGIEYMHIQIPEQKRWIQDRVERPPLDFERDEHVRVLHKLNQAEAFEVFLGTKYVGHKRFGLEGAESLIPLLDAILNRAADHGMHKTLMGMAHRGRLNVLANIIGKSYEQVFREFEGELDPRLGHGSGDVKYHVGASGIHTSPADRRLEVQVVANPSHLEAVDPVLEGMVRAHQDQHQGDATDIVLPLLIHGDAAFSGQGVVFETVNLSQLDGYHTGGTIHVVVNNQVGFTTNAAEARSSFYATDVAKAVQAPIFHVNGDDPESVVRVARLAFEFRQTFHKDVVIDLLCYRRYGHNEADEPSFTQPLMYKEIEGHRSVRKLYLEWLVNRNVISVEEGEQLLEDFRQILHQALDETRDLPPPTRAEPANPPEGSGAPTSVDKDHLDHIAERLAALPEGFTVHPKLGKVLDGRRELYQAGLVDWALGEALALGSLALEGHRIRLAGEDSTRGTFSHRHAALVDYETGAEWMPLCHVGPEQAPVVIVDSLLSEFAALGFEYGYSVVARDALVMWEAQFGDFANGAQVIIDQFVTAGEDKWNQTSGLVMLLPHGFEGQGPEHSSARIERFLANAAGHNLRVLVPSTPATYFHGLRRQLKGGRRTPLVVFTPKSLLRTRESFSPVSELSEGSFRAVIPDRRSGDKRRVLLSAGKVHYDLARRRQEGGDDSVALVRVEQLYPFPGEEIAAAVESAGADAEVMWVQEEPANMGGWPFMAERLRRLLGRPVATVARREAASPATGSYAVHASEQRELADKAFA